MTDTLSPLGPAYGNQAALDHDTVMLLDQLLSELIARGVPYERAIAAVRRCARGSEWLAC